MLRRLTAFEVELSLSPVTKLLGAAWSQALPWLLDFGLRAAPRLERGAWECCELAYGPRRALRQLALAFVLQSAIVAIQLWRRTRREPKKESGPMHSLATAETYDAWQDAASQLDQGDGGEAWRAAGGHGEALVDARSLRAAAAALRECISDSLHAAMYRMRGDLLLPRDAHGMGSSRLFDRARMGAPLVVDAYVAAAVSALAFVSETDDESVPLDARLAFFNECRHAHGRTALLLSGGAGLGTYHLGVVAALIDAGALPRVISGASAGSIVAATVCARTDAELEGIYDAMLVADEGVAAGEAPSFLGNNKPPRFGARVIFRFDFFRWRSLTSLRDAVAPGAEARSGGFGVGKGKKTLREHAAGGLMCGDHLASVIQANVGDVTFQEAFDRTGRILNIPVKQHDESGDVSHIVGFAPPRLLNYLTAPHVLVWSASRASCAVPGIYKPSPLLVRAADGSVEFEGPTVYVDGSMGADLPMETMRTLFNCNHFICSQTNPHAAVLGDLALQLVGAVAPGCASRHSTWSSADDAHIFRRGARKWFATGVALAHATLRFVKAQLRTYVHEGTRLVSHLDELRDESSRRPFAGAGVWPRGFNSLFGWSFQMLTQPYEGRPGDVTIVPWAGHLSAISAVAKTLANPEQGADIAQVLDAGRKNTWRELAKIQSHTAVERALEAGVSDLRRRLVDQVVDEAHRNTSRAQDACKSGMGRTPSFYTSPSLLALSGLAVVDPVRPRPRTSSLDFTNLSKGRPRLGSVDQTQTAADASRRAAARAARGNTRDWPESSGSESPVGAAPRRLGEAAGTSSVKGRTSWAMPAPQEHAPWKRAPSPKGAPSQKEKSEKKKTSSSGHLDADARSFYKSSTMANFYYRDRACSTDDIRRNARPRLGPRGDSSEAEKAPSF